MATNLTPAADVILVYPNGPLGSIPTSPVEYNEELVVRCKCGGQMMGHVRRIGCCDRVIEYVWCLACSRVDVDTP